MTKLDNITGNPARSQAILEVVDEAIHDGDVSYEAVAAKIGQRIRDARLNVTFEEISAEEVQVAQSILQPAEFDPADVQVESCNSSTVEPVADQDAPAMSRDEANAELQRRKEALMVAKKARMVAEYEVDRAREAVAAAVMEWVRGGPTADEIRRNENAAINRDRRSAVEHSDQRRPGPSRIDQEAFYGARGDAGTFTRKQHRFGSHHRATALTPGGPLQRPGRRGTKLPSEVQS